MRRTLLLLAPFLVLASAAPADAQVRRGLQELNASGGGITLENSSAYVYSSAYGFFLTPAIAVGPVLRGGHTRFTRETEVVTATGYAVGAQAQFHAARPEARLVPFAGGSAEFAFGDTTGPQFGAQAGVKYFVAEGGAVVPAAFLLVDTEGRTLYGLQVGLSVFIQALR
jgi:hypothetical protein